MSVGRKILVVEYDDGRGKERQVNHLFDRPGPAREFIAFLRVEGRRYRVFVETPEAEALPPPRGRGILPTPDEITPQEPTNATATQATETDGHGDHEEYGSDFAAG